MEIHKPKPIHNWRELATEIGVIVFGILIALGLEQAVEAYHAKERAQIARAAIEDEIRFSLAKAKAITEMQGCSERQLVGLSAAIGNGDQAEVRRLLGASQLPHAYTWTDAAWQSAVASDVSDRFGEQERRNYSIVYGLAQIIRGQQEAYSNSDLRLRAIASSGLSESPAAEGAELSEMAELIATLRKLEELAQAYQQAGKNLMGLEARPNYISILPFGDQPAKCRAAAAALDSSPATKR